MNVKRAVIAVIGMYACFSLCVGPVLAVAVVVAVIAGGIISAERHG